jgi:thioredoxin 1
MTTIIRIAILPLLLGTLLLVQVLPVRAQTPAGPQAPLSALPRAVPEILEFDRKLCPICRESELIIQEVKQEFPGQFEVRRLYIDEHPAIFRRYKIDIVPTQVFLNPLGQEVFRHEGVFPKEKLIPKLRELGFIKK